MSNFTHGIEIGFGAINDVERSIFTYMIIQNENVIDLWRTQHKYFTNYKESKNIFQLVFIRNIFGQCCNTHQIDTNKPVTEGLVLRFHFAATSSIAQKCSMYYIDRCVGTYIGLLFVITDRGPIQLNYEYQIVPSPLYPFSSQRKVAITIEMLCHYPSPRKKD